MKYNLILGSHVKMNQKNKYLIGCLEDTIAYNGNTFMFYTGAPQNNIRKSVETFYIKEFHSMLQKYKLDQTKIIIHASYIINLANTLRKNIFELGLSALRNEINRASKIGIKIIVLHPGSSLGVDNFVAMDKLISGLNSVLKPEDDIKIALETMAGKGNEIGRNFEQLKYIIDNVKLKNKIGVCWDTCHMHDSGYDFKNNLEEIIQKFDQQIGLKKIFAMHINDSKNILGARKDRHANIGYGNIGFETLNKIVYHQAFNNIPKILETPWINNKPPYKEEISNFKNQKFSNFKIEV